MLNSGFHMLDDITHGKDGHMDTGVQDGLIIAEDDILRDGGQYPEYTATMFIVIENYYNGRVYKKSNFAGDCETAFALAVKFALAQLLQLLL